ncbi:MAG: hypothetical protein ABH863_04855 [Candidatus Micrarchaeota archaeon]
MQKAHSDQTIHENVAALLKRATREERRNVGPRWPAMLPWHSAAKRRDFFGYGSWREYIQNHHGYDQAVHGVRNMPATKFIAYLDRLASNVVEQAPPHTTSRARPLSELDLSVLNTATTQLRRIGKLDYAQIANAHSLTLARANNIIRGLQRGRHLGKGRSGRTVPSLPQHVLDSNEYKTHRLLAMTLARNFLRWNPGIDQAVLDHAAEIGLINAYSHMLHGRRIPDPVKFITLRISDYLQSYAAQQKRIERRTRSMQQPDQDGMKLEDVLDQPSRRERSFDETPTGAMFGIVTSQLRTRRRIEQLLEMHKAGELSERYLLVYLLRSLYGFKHSETATALGYSLKTTQKSWRRAIIKIREIFKGGQLNHL